MLVRAAGAARSTVATGPGMLEALEPRRLLTSYTYTPVSEAFDLEQFVREVAAPEGVEGFGARAAALGDVDGDGAADFAVAAPGVRGTGLSDPWTGPGGKVFIYSGRTAELIRTLEDGHAGFGAALVNIGDVNADGVADLAVGSPMFAGGAGGELARAGRVWIYSGSDGSVIRTLDGAAAGDDLGWAVANVTDVSGDGVNDLLVGAPGAGGTGQAYVFSGADGAVLRTLSGETAGDRFGFAVAGGVDVPVVESANGDDGIAEYLVGAPGHDVLDVGADAGRAYAFDGATGAVRFTFSGKAAGDQFGHSVLMIGGSAINRNFMFRWVVGVPGADVPVFNRVTLEQISTAVDGGQLLFFLASGFEDGNIGFRIGQTDGARLGAEMFIVGDIHRYFEEDDTPEWAAVAPGADPAERLWFFHGSVTTSFQLVPGSPVEGAQWLVALGDADGDGNLDAAAGFPSATGGEIRLAPITTFAAPPSITAASEDGRYVVLAGFAQYGGPIPGYIFIDGTPIGYGRLPGLLPGDQIVGVNNAGLFVVTTAAQFAGGGPPTGTLEEIFFIFGGERHSLAEVVTRIDGPTPTNLSFVGMNNVGDVLFRGTVPGQTFASYVFRGGVLRYLWDGPAADINDSGMIVGTRNATLTGSVFGIGTGVAGVAVAMLPDGRIVDLPGLINAQGVNNAGIIVGVSAARRLTILSGGVTTELAQPPLPGNATDVNWQVADVDEDGRIAASLNWGIPTIGRPPSTHQRLEYLYEPGVGLRRLRDAAQGTPDDPLTFLSVLRITDDNIIYARESALLPEVPETPADTTSDPATPITATGSGGVYSVGAVNPDGEAFVLQLTQNGWRALGLPALPEDAGPAVEVLTYTDPGDGRVYAMVRTQGGGMLHWFVQGADGVFDLADTIALQTSGPMTSFVSGDGRVHIAAVDASGDVVLLYQPAPTTPGVLNSWAFSNISDEHLAPQDIATPAFVGPITAYVTRWGGMNVAGLDAEGNIHVVWWGPGITLWRADNLSANAGTPALEGRLGAMVTAWDGLNLTGVAADTGELWSTWWVPEFGGQWRADSLSAAAGSDLKFDPDSITLYVTDWGGQNIAGRDAETGEVAVYWWAPSTNQWVAETFDFGGEEDLPATTGALVSLADGQTLNLFARVAEDQPGAGSILRLFWRAQDNVWLFENLSGSPA